MSQPGSSQPAGDPGEVTTRCAVAGSPIAHSLSPALHTAAYRHLGLTGWHYGRYELTAADLPGFVDGLGPEWRGLSLTMPLKTAALALGAHDQVTGLVGAANTLVISDGRRRVYNTDVGGFAAAVGAAGLGAIGAATVLGSGATARSVIAGLARLGATEVTVVARTPAKAEPLRDLATALGLVTRIVAWEGVRAAGDLPAVDLVVQTAVARAADPIAALVVQRCRAVFDVIYDPWPTRLAAAAAAAGLTVLDGLALLVHQAVLQVELMTGHAVPAEVLTSAGRAALTGRDHP